MFVGREGELAELYTALENARGGRGGIALVEGEPGIGKSRIATELAERASGSGFLVLFGRCYEGEGAPPYWPWVQALRACVQGRDAGAVESALGLGGPDIAQIVPALREVLPALPAPLATDPEQARFRLFDAIATFLGAIARQQPLVLVLEDMHAADKPSLLLLTFVAQALRDAPVLVVCTYRNDELGRRHPLTDLLGQLMSFEGCRRLALRGLSAREVARFVELSAGQTPASLLVDAIYRQTEGNPLFVAEVVRLLAGEGHLLRSDDVVAGRVPIPHGVRDVIGRRLNRLSEECSELLILAAVIGREFNVRILEGASGLDRPRVLALLEEAVAARIVVGSPDSPARYRFAHALIRETLYEELSPVRRADLHRRVGEVMEGLYGASTDTRVDEQLALHFFHGAASGDPERAVRYAVRAAETAMAALAYEDAARHYERALEALELEPAGDATRRCELLLALGDAQSRSGEMAPARVTFGRAATLARRLSAPDALGRAALGFAGPMMAALGNEDRETVALLEEALAASPADDSALRAALLGRLAMELCYSNQGERRSALTTQAVAIARRIGDVPTLAYALTARRDTLWPGHLDERLVDAEELLTGAEASGRREVALEARSWRIRDLLELGDLAGLEVEVASAARLLEDLRFPPYYQHRALGYWTMRALMEGRFVEAERLMTECLAIGRRVVPQNAAMAFAAQRATLYRNWGRFDAIALGHKQFVERHPRLWVWRAGLAVVYLEGAREADGRREFERLAAREFGDLPEDAFWPVTMALLAESAALLRDARRSARLYEMLLPHAGRNIIIPVGGDCYGAADRFLGLLATTLRRWDEAEQHFRDALALNGRMEAQPLVAWTQFGHAVMYLARDEQGDQARARSLLGQALETASALGMTFLEGRVRALQRGDTPATMETGLVGPGVVFRKQGEYWMISTEGPLVRLKDSIGLRCLAELVRHPGREFLALDLLLAVRHGWGPTPKEGDAGEMLDEEAKAAYRRRLEELRAELEEAQGFNDQGRVARAQTEIDVLGQELARGLRLGGRDRRAGSSIERARVNVTRTIKEALRRISANDPALGHHLTACVRTGTFCSFDPARETSRSQRT